MDTATTVIVGGGMAGLATAWALAERGAERLVVVEQANATGLGSSGLNAGILRTAIDSPVTRALARQTQRLLGELPASLSKHLSGPPMDGRGLVIAEGRADLPEPRWLEDLRPDGATPITQAELRQRLPGFEPVGERLWWLPQLGVIQRDGLMAALLASVQAMGVDVRTETRVSRIVLDSEGAASGVELASGTSLRAERIVLAPGGWANRLAATCGTRFPGRATRRHLFVTGPSPQVDPDWPVVWDDAAGFYSLPHAGGLMLCLCDEEDTDPEACVPDPLIGRRLRRRLAASLPALADLPIARSWCAMRTLSEDDHPVAGQDPKVPGLWWVGALGGHGMSIGLALGRSAAALMQGERLGGRLDELLDPASAAREYQPTRHWQP